MTFSLIFSEWALQRHAIPVAELSSSVPASMPLLAIPYLGLGSQTDSRASLSCLPLRYRVMRTIPTWLLTPHTLAPKTFNGASTQ
jgi:hypothetical protein